MMFGAVRCPKSTSGSNTSGFASCSCTLHASSLLTVRWSGWPQCAHSLSILTDSCSLRKCPCTKGVAIASSAQAANVLSPLLKLSRWGVLSDVTGKAQLTSPASFNTRKNRCFCNSSSIATTLASGSSSSLWAISSAIRGFSSLRGSSLTTKFLTR